MDLSSFLADTGTSSGRFTSSLDVNQSVGELGWWMTSMMTSREQDQRGS
jgi:hypothetical protein